MGVIARELRCFSPRHALNSAPREQYCRRIGYQKTSVADIASELGMSPANVYRFFPAKSAINESICKRVMSEVVDIAIARTDAPALEKLDRVLTAVHHHKKTRLIEERRMHDMIHRQLDGPAASQAYLALGSLNRLLVDLRQKGIVTKVRTLKTGRTVGGIAFTRGPLACLLRNRFYIGEVVFRDEVFPASNRPFSIVISSMRCKPSSVSS